MNRENPFLNEVPELVQSKPVTSERHYDYIHPYNSINKAPREPSRLRNLGSRALDYIKTLTKPE